MIYTDKLSLQTEGFSDIIDITEQVEAVIGKSRIDEGLVTVSVPGSTAGITTIEYEPGLVADLKEVLEKLAPRDRVYHHDSTWGDGNGFSHVRAALLGANRSFPVSKGKIALGTWQQIVLVDCDNRSRRREIIVQVMGERCSR